MHIKLSGVVITLNEADNIERCIKSMQGLCDEIIIIDSGSTDDTVKIAQDNGAVVHKINWLGYGQSKNYGHLKARNDWIISLDADEVIDEDLHVAIQAIRPEDWTQVYKMNRMSFYEGQWIKHSGWYPDWCSRIFHKSYAHWSEDHVHEKLQYGENPQYHKLDGHIRHYSYKSIEDHLAKIDKYAQLKALAWIEENKQPSFWKRYFGSAFKYIKTYFIDRGYKDGTAGKQIARLNRLLIKKQIEYYDTLKRSR